MFSSRAFADLARAFHHGHVRYLVVGGLAVVAHGYTRLTLDIDIVLDFDADNLQRAMTQLSQLGYRPRIPVALADFMNADLRHTWAQERHMIAFTVIAQAVELDLFTEHPFDFPSAYADAAWKSLDDDHSIGIPFLDKRRLIAMKQSAGRSKDLLDIEHLQQLDAAP